MSGCQESDFGHCFVNLTIPEAEIFPNMNDQDLDKLCSNYKGVEHCVSNSTHLCTARQQSKISAQIQVLNYLCTTGYEDYRSTRPCLDDQAMLQATQSCNTSFSAGMRQLQHNTHSTRTQKMQQICTNIYNMIDCVKDSASEICTSDAANWIYNMKTRIMSGTISQVGCDRQTDHMPAIMAIAFAIVISLIVLAVAFIVVYKKVKAEDGRVNMALSRTSNRHADSSTNCRGKHSTTIANSPNNTYSSLCDHTTKEPQQPASNENKSLLPVDVSKNTKTESLKPNLLDNQSGGNEKHDKQQEPSKRCTEQSADVLPDTGVNQLRQENNLANKALDIEENSLVSIKDVQNNEESRKRREELDSQSRYSIHENMTDYNLHCDV